MYGANIYFYILHKCYSINFHCRKFALLKLGYYYQDKNAYFQTRHELRIAPNQDDLNLKNICSYFWGTPSSKKSIQHLLTFKTKLLKNEYSFLRHLHHLCMTCTSMMQEIGGTTFKKHFFEFDRSMFVLKKYNIKKHA